MRVTCGMQGYVYLAALPGPDGYDDIWNAAFGGARCMLENATVCAYNVISNSTIACVSTQPDGSYELGVAVGVDVRVSVTYADHNFTLISNVYPNADNIYVDGPIRGLDFQVRPHSYHGPSPQTAFVIAAYTCMACPLPPAPCCCA